MECNNNCNYENNSKKKTKIIDTTIESISEFVFQETHTHTHGANFDLCNKCATNEKPKKMFQTIVIIIINE